MMQEANNQLDLLKNFLHSQTPLMLALGKGQRSKELISSAISCMRISHHIIRLQATEECHPSQLTKMLSKNGIRQTLQKS